MYRGTGRRKAEELGVAVKGSLQLLVGSSLDSQTAELGFPEVQLELLQMGQSLAMVSQKIHRRSH
jgi:hypothetical protein